MTDSAPRPSRAPLPRIARRAHAGRRCWARSPGLQAETDGRDTTLRGALPDQAALHAVLVEIEALGLELLEVRRQARR